MADTIDDTETFTIALTAGEVPDSEPSKLPMVVLVGAGLIGLWLLLRG